MTFVTPPAVSPYFLNQPATAAFTCNDNLSGFSGGNPVNGPAAGSSGPSTVNTSSVGAKNFTVTATDFAGYTASSFQSYNVNFGFAGFFEPYAPPPRAFKSKSTIPLKWQYTDYSGAAVDSAGANPTPGIAGLCGQTPYTDLVDIEDAGASGLRYDASTRSWQYNWQTKGFNAGCYVLQVQTPAGGNRPLFQTMLK